MRKINELVKKKIIIGLTHNRNIFFAQFKFEELGEIFVQCPVQIITN